MANDIKQKIVLEGEKQYNQALNDAKRNLKTLRSELKAETAELGANATAQQKNETKMKSLQKQIAEQEKVVKTYRSALEEVKTKYADNEDAIAKWEQKLNDARTSLANMNNELQGLGSGFKDVQSNADMATVAAKSVADSFGKLSEIGGAISSGIEEAFKGMISTVKDAIGEVWGEITDLAARSNGLVDLAGYWNTDVLTIQKYKGAVAEASGSLEDLNAIVTKINAQDKKKITDLVGVSKENYKDDWEYAMAVMDAMSKLQKDKRNEIGFELFGKGATKAFDLLNDWQTVLDHLDKYDPTKGGYGMTSEQLSTMSELYDKINGMKESWSQLKDMVTAGLFGELSLKLVGNGQAILDALLKYMNAESGEERDAAIAEIEENILAMFNAAKEAIEKGIELLGTIAEDLKKSENPVAQALGNLLSGLVDALKWLTEDNMKNVVKALEVLAAFWLTGKGAMMGAKILEIVKNINLIKEYSAGGGATAGAEGGGVSGIGSSFFAGAGAKLAGAGASVSQIVSMLGGAGGLLGVVVDRVLNETNAGRGLQEGGLAGLWGGLKTDFSEKKAEIEKNASTFVQDWENVFKFMRLTDLGENAIRFWDEFWKGKGPLFTPENMEEADWRPSYMQGTPNNYYNPNMIDPSWWQSNGGNAGNTDGGMSSADAKNVTAAVNQMPGAVARGISGIKVVMDGTVVGRLVAGEVSRQIAQYVQ